MGIVNEIFLERMHVSVKNKKTNCYIYTRVSTAMQVDGYSILISKCWLCIDVEAILLIFVRESFFSFELSFLLRISDAVFHKA